MDPSRVQLAGCHDHESKNSRSQQQETGRLGRRCRIDIEVHCANRVGKVRRPSAQNLNAACVDSVLGPDRK